MAVYAKEAPSEEDVVNVIIYPSEKSMSIDSWNLSCRADYEDVTGQARSAGGGMMEKHIASGEEDGGTYFYKNGLPASGIPYSAMFMPSLPIREAITIPISIMLLCSMYGADR